MLPGACELPEGCFVPCWVPRAENRAWQAIDECLLNERLRMLDKSACWAGAALRSDEFPAGAGAELPGKRKTGSRVLLGERTTRAGACHALKVELWV